MTTATEKDVTCYGRVVTRHATQEWYETSTRDAIRRAQDLRALGYHVTVAAMGSQVTSVGYVRMTLITIDHFYGEPAPAPSRIERV